MALIARAAAGAILIAAFALGLGMGSIDAQGRATASRQGLGRSLLIYPPQRSAMRMTHARPEHRALECARCHRGATESERAEDLLVPAERDCLPCHQEDLDRARGEPARCEICHRGFEPATASTEALVPASHLPNARLRFSHRAHASQTCLSCHAGVDQAAVADRRHLPAMEQCFECHAPAGLDRDGASHPLTCAGCHLTEPSGQIRARWPEGWMNPPRWMAGMRHDHEWLVRHRWVAADRGPLCAQCHDENDCAECHDGRVRVRRVHPGDYLTTHPVMARRDQPRCASCHTVSQFCGECHGRLGIAPIAAPDVRSPERWHPPAALWTRGPNLHAIEAVRSMQSCASCHAEEDCVQCHGGAGVGLGISPHPPGFASSCRAALSTNARACITCHGDLESLLARCR